MIRTLLDRFQRWRTGTISCPGSEQLSAVVVTRWAPRGSVLKVHYVGEWYGLVHPEDWKRGATAISKDLPFSIEGVPVQVDEPLARQIMFDGLPE